MIIGLSGYAQSGKDEVAKVLVEDYGYKRVAFADKIKAPLLMTHGEADDNTGTFPINSERLYAAIKGHGGTVRFVYLPYEAHGYKGKENLLHLLYEQGRWLDKYLK